MLYIYRQGQAPPAKTDHDEHNNPVNQLLFCWCKQYLMTALMYWRMELKFYSQMVHDEMQHQHERAVSFHLLYWTYSIAVHASESQFKVIADDKITTS
jgi:hypothetical protein